MNRLAGIVLLILCLTGACHACAESAGGDWADMYALSVENAIEYGDLREEWAKEPDVYKPAPQGAEIVLLPKDAVLSGDIALESGFGSVSSFNRIFQEYKNCSPTRFRALYGQKPGEEA